MGAICCEWSSLAASEPSRPTVVVPGQPVTLTVSIPTENRPAGAVTYEVEPAAGVELVSGRTGPLTWDPAVSHALRVRLRLVVGAKQPPGRFIAARIALRWSNGQRESIDVWALVRPGVQHTTTLSAKNLQAEVVAVPEAAPPGAAVRLRFYIYNNEESDERLRLHVVAGPGWTLSDADQERRELLVEAYSDVEGDLDLMIPKDAAVGARQLVRLLVEVIGDAGAVEAQNYVTVVKRGRSTSVGPVVTGTSTMEMSRLGTSGLAEAQSASGLELATSLGADTSITFSYERGLRDNLSNYRYDEEPSKIGGNLRRGGWDINFGNHVPSQGNALAGPFVQGIGGGLRRTTGRLLADLVVTRPAQFGGDANGHLVRGRLGLKTKKGFIAFAGSDFGRPDGGYTTLPTVQQIPLDADEEEQIEIERALTARAPSNRVQGAGMELEFRPNRTHRFTARTGALRLANAVGNRSTSPVGEASYAFSSPQIATFNLRWREMPPTLAGIFISGDELTVDGSIRLVGPVRVVGRAFRNASETVGRAFQTHGDGGSFGLRYQQSGRRLEARWNYRESQFTMRNVRRTISVAGGTSLGPLVFSGNADLGSQESGRVVRRLAYYRTDLRWTGETGLMSINFSHAENNGRRTERVDVIASLNLARWELASGAWGTRGYVSGGEPGVWASVGVPLRGDTLILVGIDRAPIEWGVQPTWRATLGVRQRFALPLPFDRHPGPAISTGAEVDYPAEPHATRSPRYPR